MCTRTLVGNIRLRSVTPTLVDNDYHIENGHDEQGMKLKSYFITFYKFSVTVHNNGRFIRNYNESAAGQCQLGQLANFVVFGMILINELKRSEAHRQLLTVFIFVSG